MALEAWSHAPLLPSIHLLLSRYLGWVPASRTTCLRRQERFEAAVSLSAPITSRSCSSAHHGKRKQYLKHFYGRLRYNANGIHPAALDYDAIMYSQPGFLWAAFSVYKAFKLGADENLKSLMEKGNCRVPVLGLNGEFGPFAQDMESSLPEMYENYAT